MKTLLTSTFAFCAIFLSAAFGAPDIRITPLSMNISRITKPQIYLEIDWMDDGAHSHKPSQAVIDRIVAAYAREGFDIHIDVSNLITPANTNISIVPSGPSASPQVQAIRDANFNHINDPRYYYSIWGHNYNSSSSSGVADLPGRIHLVTLGSFPGQTGTADQQVGTLIHEFGHNLNQRHGGTDGTNYKPNYVSIMNYHYQLTGIGAVLFAKGWANSAAGWNEFGYSHGTLPDLDENHLNETVGIGLGRAVDWDGSGSATDTNVADNIHNPILNAGFVTGLPTGWTIVNNGGTTVNWRFDDPGSRGNLTGGTGLFAIADSDNAGLVNVDTELRTNVLNCTNRDDVVFQFRSDFRFFQAEIADVDVSINGAAGPWTNLWRRTGADERGPIEVVLNVPQANNQSNVMFRFHYYNANNEWWWQVDDVSVPGRTMITDFDNWGDIISNIQDGVVMPSLEIPVEPFERCITAEEAEIQRAELDALLKQRGPDPGVAYVPDAPQPTDGFTIFNDGDTDLVVSSITPQTAAPWLSVSPTLPLTIRQGGSRTIAVSANFTTAPNNSTTTRLLVASNDPDENPYPGGVNITVVQAPNLTPYKNPSWSDKIVVSNVTGTNTDSTPLLSTNTLYVDWAVVNAAPADILVNFFVPLSVDGTTMFTYNVGAPTNAGIQRLVIDANIGSLNAGPHTIGIVADSTLVVTELDETDNAYTKNIFVNAANDNFANGQTLAGASGTIMSHNANMTREAGEPLITGNSGGHSIWFNWTAPITGPATIDTFGSGFDTLLGVYTGSAVGSLTLIAQNDDFMPPTNVQSKVQFTAVAGTVYRIAVDGYNPGTGADTGALTLHYLNTAITSNADSGFGSLRQVIADVTPGATIAFDASLSGATITLTTGALLLNKNITIDASTLLGGLTISGNNNSRVFNVTAGNVTLKKLTIANGQSADFGGGLDSVTNGTLTINDCKFISNQSTGTGGAITAQFGSLAMNRTTVSGNMCANVSGVYIQDEQAIITACTFDHNIGSDAIRLGAASAGFTTSLNLLNSTVSDNSISTFEGSGVAVGVYANAGRTASAFLTNCTVTKNSATQPGQPAIYVRPGVGTTSFSLSNTIVSGNTSGGSPSDISGSATPGSSFNLIGTGGGLTNGVNANIVGVNNPQLGPLKNNGGPTFTHAPLTNSVAIDRGKDEFFTSADQRGSTRPVTYNDPSIVPPGGGDRSDIGAVELAPGVLPTSAVSRKTHGGAGTFNINLPFTGVLGVECRSGGATNDYQAVITFASPVTFSSAALNSGVGSVGSATGSGTNTATVNLTGVTNAQRLTIALFGVTSGANSGDVGVPLGVLIGDGNANGSVNASDVSQIKGRIGQTLDATNFRSDVNTNGSINASDTSIAKSRTGTALP